MSMPILSRSRKLSAVVAAVLLLFLAGIGGVGAQGPRPTGATGAASISAGCQPGSSYDSGCDVDHDGAITAVDLQRVAARFAATGNFVSDGWLLTGNSGTISTTNFLGTTDGQPLILRTNNLERLRVTSAGRLGLGTTAPNEQLELTGNLRLPPTTAATGIIRSGSNTLLHTFGTNNFFAGVGAGNLTMTGESNTATGDLALAGNTSGSYNTVSGYQALVNNTQGLLNTATGYGALNHNTSGNKNAAFGPIALPNNTTGSGNTAVGYAAGATGDFANGNVTGSNNTYLGYQSGPATSAQLNNAAAIGYNATVAISNALVLGGTGVDAVKVGIGTTTPNEQLELTGNLRLPATTATTGIIRSGSDTLLHTFGLYNFFAGVDAGNLAMTGCCNAALGTAALTNNGGGNYNTASGFQALYSNTSGEADSGAGANALYSNTAGNENTAAGKDALFYNTTGSGNTALGYGAGRTANDANANTTGSHNTFLGYKSGPATTTQLSNATAIGYNAPVSCSNCLVLGGTGGDAVNVGIGLSNPTHQLQLSNNDAAKPTSNTWSVVSDRRLKTDIQPFSDGLSTLARIDPVRYTLNGKGGMPKGAQGIGVIAQDVQEVIPYTISTFKAKLNPEDKAETELYSFDSSALTFVTINAVKELKAEKDGEIANLQDQVGSLKQQNQALEAEKEAQQQQMQALEARLTTLEKASGQAVAQPAAPGLGNLPGAGLLLGGVVLVVLLGPRLRGGG